MNNDYQTLINGIFVCGLPALPFVLEKEDIQVVVDLRAEADKTETKGILIPLVDGQPNQEHLLREAIGNVVRAYEQGKKVVLHWKGGKSRTGSVAIGVLMELKAAASIEEAEKMVKQVRPEVDIHPEFINDLKRLYPEQ